VLLFGGMEISTEMRTTNDIVTEESIAPERHVEEQQEEIPSQIDQEIKYNEELGAVTISSEQCHELNQKSEPEKQNEVKREERHQEENEESSSPSTSPSSTGSSEVEIKEEENKVVLESKTLVPKEKRIPKPRGVKKEKKNDLASPGVTEGQTNTETETKVEKMTEMNVQKTSTQLDEDGEKVIAGTEVKTLPSGQGNGNVKEKKKKPKKEKKSSPSVASSTSPSVEEQSVTEGSPQPQEGLVEILEPVEEIKKVPQKPNPRAGSSTKTTGAKRPSPPPPPGESEEKTTDPTAKPEPTPGRKSARPKQPQQSPLLTLAEDTEAKRNSHLAEGTEVHDTPEVSERGDPLNGKTKGGSGKLSTARPKPKGRPASKQSQKGLQEQDIVTTAEEMVTELVSKLEINEQNPIPPPPVLAAAVPLTIFASTVYYKDYEANVFQSQFRLYLRLSDALNEKMRMIESFSPPPTAGTPTASATAATVSESIGRARKGGGKRSVTKKDPRAYESLHYRSEELVIDIKEIDLTSSLMASSYTYDGSFFHSQIAL
jgi:hypothetical protein